MDIEVLKKNIIKNYPTDKHYTLKITEQHTDINIKHELFKELGNSRFTLPNDIMQSFIYNSSSYHIIIQYGSITLNCIAPYEIIPPIRFLLRLCKRIQCILNIFSIQKSFTIWLLPIEVNRSFPNGSIIEPININGGYTYHNGNTIYVYRYEECAKVILHEILHHSPFDTFGKWTNEQVNQIRTLCNIQESFDLNINEAIVEFWAILFECLLISFEYNIPFSLLIKKEQEWSRQQSYKLLSYQNKYLKQWTETSNSYCYIILKTVLLLNYENFIKIKTPYSTYDLKEFILKNIKNLLTVNLKNVATNKKLKLENSSMRMTLFGDI